MLFTMPLSVIFQTPLSLEQLPIFMADMALAYLTVQRIFIMTLQCQREARVH